MEDTTAVLCGDAAIDLDVQALRALHVLHSKSRLENLSGTMSECVSWRLESLAP